MILNPAQILYDLANEEAKKLQIRAGRPPEGIKSTQVKGLIIALGNYLAYLETPEIKKRIEKNRT
jgi:hypothetical protein